MKIVLNKTEVKAYKEFFETVDAIEGIPSESIDILKDQILSTKSMVMTLITGQLTIEIPQDLIIGLIGITTEFIKESTPALRAIISLVKALKPSAKKYTENLKKIAVEYTDTEIPQWKTISIESETLKEAI